MHRQAYMPPLSPAQPGTPPHVALHHPDLGVRVGNFTEGHPGPHVEHIADPGSAVTRAGDLGHVELDRRLRSSCHARRDACDAADHRLGHRHQQMRVSGPSRCRSSPARSGRRARRPPRRSRSGQHLGERAGPPSIRSTGTAAVSRALGCCASARLARCRARCAASGSVAEMLERPAVERRVPPVHQGHAGSPARRETGHQGSSDMGDPTGGVDSTTRRNVERAA